MIHTKIFWSSPILGKEINENNTNISWNTPGTAGGPGGRYRTLAVKSRKNARKIKIT